MLLKVQSYSPAELQVKLTACDRTKGEDRGDHKKPESAGRGWTWAATGCSCWANVRFVLLWLKDTFCTSGAWFQMTQTPSVIGDRLCQNGERPERSAVYYPRPSEAVVNQPVQVFNGKQAHKIQISLFGRLQEAAQFIFSNPQTGFGTVISLLPQLSFPFQTGSPCLLLFVNLLRGETGSSLSQQKKWKTTMSSC